MNTDQLERLSNELRIAIVEMIAKAKSGHPGGSLSAIDLITALFFDEMRGEIPKTGSYLKPDAQYATRDHFVLSKGHAVPALYAVLAKKGILTTQELSTLRQTGSRLQGHPDRVRIPCVEASTGSLGQGLSVAQGMAMGVKMEKGTSRVYCMVGDGEIQEGQIWEAALSAPKFHLSNLCVILDHNNGQIDGRVDQVMPIEPIANKWEAFGWRVQKINGHSMQEIKSAFAEARKSEENGDRRPTFIIAQTVKGKGVSFMEHGIGWHGVAPTAEEAEKAKVELLAGNAKGGTRG